MISCLINVFMAVCWISVHLSRCSSEDSFNLNLTVGLSCRTPGPTGVRVLVTVTDLRRRFRTFMELHGKNSDAAFS